MQATYEIMHKNRAAAILGDTGICEIPDPQFLPQGLFLEETVSDMETMVNNMLNFYAWCAGRVLTLDRRFAKEILNTIGVSQAGNDREKAKIALSYRCLTLTDVFWVRISGERISFEEVNLYDNHLSNAFVEVSLRGRQMTASIMELAPDLSTSGCFPKAWVRKEDGFWLYKDGEDRAVVNELLASEIARCFDLSQVLYLREEFDGQPVSASRIFTDQDHSICTWEHFQIHAINHDIDPALQCLAIDPVNYYRMNIVDYLIGNTDRHWGNWGFLLDNETNMPYALHPFMDLNQSFNSYDDINGARCLTSFGKRVSQKEAALQAVKTVGLGQLTDIGRALFEGQEPLYDMFMKRLELMQINDIV